MARSGSALIFPEIEDVIDFNRRLIERYGGDFQGVNNLINRGSLEWVLDVIQHPFFGIDPYPSIAHKAALLAWAINDGHVFNDGNKRTSMFTAAVFLDINGYHLEASDGEIVNIALMIAKKHENGINYDLLVNWFEKHIR